MAQAIWLGEARAGKPCAPSQAESLVAAAHQCRPVGYSPSAAGEGQALSPALSSSSLTRSTAGAGSKAGKKRVVRWGEQI